MGGEGHMLDMIRRLKEGRDSANLRRARTNERKWDVSSGNPKKRKKPMTVTLCSELSSSSGFYWHVPLYYGLFLFVDCQFDKSIFL